MSRGFTGVGGRGFLPRSAVAEVAGKALAPASVAATGAVSAGTTLSSGTTTTAGTGLTVTTGNLAVSSGSITASSSVTSSGGNVSATAGSLVGNQARISTSTVTLATAAATFPNTNGNSRINNTSGGHLTVTSTPTITAGASNGAIMIITCPSSQSFNTVLRDEANLAGTKLRFTGGTDKTLTPGSAVTMVYNSTTAEWSEM